MNFTSKTIGDSYNIVGTRRPWTAGWVGFSYNDVDIIVIDIIDMLGRCNQNSNFDELDIGDDMAKATDTIWI